MNISEHISFDEATQSPTALRLRIINTPSEMELIAMRSLAEYCFEPLRKWYGKPIKINSFYRCKELNKAVGGSNTSQHCKGEAIDISAGNREENKKLYDWCKANLIYDQLIWEFGDDVGPDWVHISYAPGNNRNDSFRVK